jgi:hypothetical protein
MALAMYSGFLLRRRLLVEYVVVDDPEVLFAVGHALVLDLLVVGELLAFEHVFLEDLRADVFGVLEDGAAAVDHVQGGHLAVVVDLLCQRAPRTLMNDAMAISVKSASWLRSAWPLPEPVSSAIFSGRLCLCLS